MQMRLGRGFQNKSAWINSDLTFLAISLTKIAFLFIIFVRNAGLREGFSNNT
jgi:hypothetical protein